MKNKTPSYEEICAKANSRKLGPWKRTKRVYPTYSKLEISYMTRKAKS